MSEPTNTPDAPEDDLGSLTVEDDPDGTVDAAELAGSANDGDADDDLQPTYSEEDVED